MLYAIDVSYLRTIFDFIEQTPVSQKSIQGKPNKSIKVAIGYGKLSRFFVTYKDLPHEQSDRIFISFRLNGTWACFRNQPLPVYQKASGEYNFSLEDRASFEHSFHAMFKGKGVEEGYLVFTQDEYTTHPDGRILNGLILNYTNLKNDSIRFREMFLIN